MEQDLKKYYHDRAKEYDKVYSNIAEQDDLRAASLIFQDLFKQQTVLEIACGTGYWTAQMAKTARAIFATDINESVINIAKAKPLHENVAFAVADMFSLTTPIKYQGLFGGFIWSHILLQDLDRCLHHVKQFVVPNGTMVFIDSNAVEGTNHDKKRITRVDAFGNTFQQRQLENGVNHEVLKNFPTTEFLHQKLEPIATDINFIKLAYYWIVSCKLK
jgi:ubiquinone/menaquinone biosynthesis C-methylase UbiE